MLEMVKEKAKEEGKSINSVYLDRYGVMVYSGWTKKQIRYNVKSLIEYGYLEIVSGKGYGQTHKYRVLNITSRISELLKKIPTHEEMKKRLKLKENRNENENN